MSASLAALSSSRRQPPPARSDPFASLLEPVTGAWSSPSRFADTGVHHGYRQITVVSAGRWLYPAFRSICVDLEPVRQAWLSWIDAGGFIVEHVDAGPHHERWQIPMTEAGTLYQNGAPVRYELGSPYRVAHHRPHRVANDDATPRIVLVVDRDIIVSDETTPLVLTGA